ncbi:MAG: ABC transporter permease subunit [Verrucomicrobiota bacterium]
MFQFVLYRVLQAVPVLFVIITMTFFMARLAPGGPFTQERTLAPQVLDAMNEKYGLNDPWHIQYFRYLGSLMKGDLGPSFSSPGRSVNEVIANKIPVSIELGSLALIFSLVLGVPCGMIAALQRNRPLDYVPMTAAMIGICLPTFVLGPLLSLCFGVWLGWFNVSGWFDFSDRVLPAVTLGLPYAAYIARLTRGSMLGVLSLDYIRTARAKGVPERKVILKHAIRGGMTPVISYLGPAFAGLLAGSFVVEKIFVIPGLGSAFVEGAINRDYTLVMGTVIFYSVLLLVMNIVVDFVLVLLNPRLKFETA